MICNVVDTSIDVAKDVVDGVSDGVANIVADGAGVGSEACVRSSVGDKSCAGVEVVVAAIIGHKSVVASICVGDKASVAVGTSICDESGVSGIRCGHLVIGQECVGASPSAGHWISSWSSIGILLVPSGQRGGGEGVGVGQGVASQKVVVAVVDEAVASS